jgi:hypothetical protein
VTTRTINALSRPTMGDKSIDSYMSESSVERRLHDAHNMLIGE